MMIYGWREREELLRFFEIVTGLRMNHNYIRPGGVACRPARRVAGGARLHPRLRCRSVSRSSTCS
ncbi:MAG: hypothetical protein V9E94_20635 [Microthrixaceae bacterium]